MNKSILYFVLTVLIHFYTGYISYAQQPLNLSFDKPSVEGDIRPWGWNKATFYSMKTKMDDKVKVGGKYSFSITALENGIHSFNTLLEPYELRNEKVRVEVWVKTEKIKGFAFIEIGYETDENSKNIQSTQIKKDQEWNRISAEIFIPDNADIVYIDLKIEGRGRVWFDEARLIVNGIELGELEIAEDVTKDQLNWFDANTYTFKIIDTVNPKLYSSNRATDFNRFSELVSRAQIIALGESTHGTSEFFRLKHRILEHSVHELGVRLFAIEDNQAIVERVNQFVLGGSGTARESMKGMFNVWQTPEMEKMVEWIRTYNDANPEDVVEFVGFDMQSLITPMDHLTSFLKETDKGLLPYLRKIKELSNYYSKNDSLKIEFREATKSLLEIMEEKQSEWFSQTPDTLSILTGIQYGRLIYQFAENAKQGHRSLYRDKAMAENISWLIHTKSRGRKMLIWAHDSHVSRGDHSEVSLNVNSGHSMGAYLSKKYKEDYAAFSLLTNTGEYRSQKSYLNRENINCPLLSGPRGSLENTLHKISEKKSSKNLFLDMKIAREEEWLTQPIPTRFANHVCFEYSFWTRYSVPFQYDGIFYIDHSSPAGAF